MEDKYTHARTSVYNINYHIVWCTKYRRKVLSPKISERLYEILEETAANNGFEIGECKVGEGDLVHCFVSAPPKLSVTQIVRSMKGVSGQRLLSEFPEITEKLWKGHLWNSSYFCETIGSTSEDDIRRYIERQKTCQH